ncbi:hypothetical protein [Sporisorium scitamineum]|uniref:Uncharacterized protein n=1 Tax=Sporisorium scitamineum TaxID=49012 RepID=A0A0F7SCI5_9BASI|nr:hypothetical protein [Sporisorium scitamineum]
MAFSRILVFSHTDVLTAIEAIRDPANLRRFIVLGGPDPYDDHKPGIAVAYPISHPDFQDPNQGLFGIISVSRNDQGRDTVRFHGYVLVINANGIGHYEYGSTPEIPVVTGYRQPENEGDAPEQVIYHLIEQGSIINTHQLFERQNLESYWAVRNI